MRMLAIVLTTSLLGCGISEERFTKRFAKLFCRNLEECGKLEVAYGTHEECIDAMSDFVDDEMIPEDCEIVSKKARACLKELRKSKGECGINDNQTPSCDDVANCSGETDTGGNTGSE